jgi:hypothetical protein
MAPRQKQALFQSILKDADGMKKHSPYQERGRIILIL